MPVSDTLSTTFYLPSVPPGPPVVGLVPADKTPATLSDFDPPLHLNIRDFRGSLKPLRLTLADLSYHSVHYWNALTVAGLAQTDAPIVGDEDWLTYGLIQDDLDLLTQDDLDLLTQSQIESSAGIGEVAAWNYNPGMVVEVPTTGRRFRSTFDHDDLLQAPFDDISESYYIELVLRDFPAKFGSPTFDHDQSFISFSTSTNNNPVNTVEIPFSATIANIDGGGNVVWRVNRNVLSAIDMSQIRRIDFYLVAVGGTATFKAEAMRLIPSDYPYYDIGIDTKTGTLSKNPSQQGTNITAQVHPQPILNTGSNKAISFSEIVRFNTGHHPVDPLYNSFTIYLRANTGSGEYIEVTLQSNDDHVAVLIYEGGVGVRQIEAPALVEEADHFLQIDLIEDQIRVVIWESVGNYPTNVVLNTETDGIITLERVVPGWVGIDFRPYNADFTIDYMFARDAAIASFVSRAFNSNTPIKGVSLYSVFSPPSQILDREAIEEGPAVNLLRIPVLDSGKDNGDFLISAGINDVSVSADTTFTYDYDNPFISSGLGVQASYKVRKQLANAFIGGVQWDTVVKINDPLNATIRGAVRFDENLNYGVFRVVLFDKFWENVAFTSIIPVESLVLGKWNEFEIPILNEEIYHNEFRVQFQHVGVVETEDPSDDDAVGTFWLDAFRIETDTIIWEASNDNGLSWMRFFDTIGTQYQGVNFPTFGNQLKVRARAFSVDAWHKGYEAIVHYAQPGRINE
jgi:hypothetical protein